MARRRIDAVQGDQLTPEARLNAVSEYFGELAEQYSIEAASRALHGEVPPIQKHGGQPKLEQEAFSLRPGELSGIVQVGQRCVILFCLGHTKPEGVSFQQVRSEIYAAIHEKKQRQEMAKYFQHLQDNATIDNYLAGTSRSPKKRSRGLKNAIDVPAFQPPPSPRR